MDVVVLAGGKTPPELAPLAPEGERALIPVHDVPLVDRVLDSLQEAAAGHRLILVATPSTLRHVGERAVAVPAGDTLSGNLLRGAEQAVTDQILIVTADVPLAKPATWSAFLTTAEERGLEAAYPIVRRQTVEAQFPGGRRTYGALRDGAFTGGNAFLMPRGRLRELEALIETAYGARKNPLKLARLLGLSFIIKALTRQLSIAALESKMSGLLGCRAGAVEVQDAAIAFDVDKPSDLETATRHLAQPSGV